MDGRARVRSLPGNAPNFNLLELGRPGATWLQLTFRANERDRRGMRRLGRSSALSANRRQRSPVGPPKRKTSKKLPHTDQLDRQSAASEKSAFLLDDTPVLPSPKRTLPHAHQRHSGGSTWLMMHPDSNGALSTQFIGVPVIVRVDIAISAQAPESQHMSALIHGEQSFIIGLNEAKPRASRPYIAYCPAPLSLREAGPLRRKLGTRSIREAIQPAFHRITVSSVEAAVLHMIM